MTLKQAKNIAANPGSYPVAELKLAHMKLGNAALRAFSSSPHQKALQGLRAQIEAMPREMWVWW